MYSSQFLLNPEYPLIFARDTQFLKRLFTILTLAAVLLQTFSKGVILLGFEINRDFIAQTLCIKKAQTNNCCKGSCQLTKQLKEDDNTEHRGSPQNAKDKSEVQLFCETSHMPALPEFTTHTPGMYYLLPVSTLQKSSIFHPPLPA